MRSSLPSRPLPGSRFEKSDEALTKEYRKIAERRVRLGLVLAEIGRANNVTVSEQELNQAIMAEARKYGPQALGSPVVLGLLRGGNHLDLRQA